MSEIVRAWHFTRLDGTTCHLTQKEVPGKTYRINQEPELCHRGFHACVNPLDALAYGSGFWVKRVEIGGTILHGEDKIVGTTRRVVAEGDATHLILLFTADGAQRVLHYFEEQYPDDHRPRQAIQTVRDYVVGKATEEQLMKAAEAAWAAEAAAEAAWAARAAAWAAAWAAEARAAEHNWQTAELKRRLLEFLDCE